MTVQDRLSTVLDRLHAWRDANPRRRTLYRIAIGALGGVVTIGGVILLPYPGPGWLIIFAGLGILATEFAWAKRVLDFAKRYYDRWIAWMGRQNWFVRMLVLAAIFALVVVILWLLGLFSLVGGWFGLHWPWLASPIFG